MQTLSTNPPSPSITIGIERHETPDWAARIVTAAGDLNPLTAEPLYRLIWGQNRLEWVGGKWTDRDPVTHSVLREVIEQRKIPKYSHLGANKWFVERWYPPDHFGSRAMWEAQTVERVDGIFIAALGPYPSRGDYDHFYTMEGPKGEYRELTPGRVRWIASVIRTSELASKKEIAARNQEAREQRQAEQDSLDMEMIRSASPAFGSEPNVTVL